jgi:hypothetical protein
MVTCMNNAAINVWIDHIYLNPSGSFF